MKEFPAIKLSWIILVISGLLIIAGLFDFWTSNFRYWLINRLVYGIGAILFLFDK